MCFVYSDMVCRSTLSSRIYVTENGTLKGYITMAALLTHQPKTPVADLLRELEEVLKEVRDVMSSAHLDQHGSSLDFRPMILLG